MRRGDSVTIFYGQKEEKVSHLLAQDIGIHKYLLIKEFYSYLAK